MNKNNKVTVYESFSGKSTGTFLKDHINTALADRYFVYYIDTNDGFSKYGIQPSEALCVVKSNEYVILHTLFTEILNNINAGEASPCVIIIDHFEMIKVDHPSHKNTLIKTLHYLSKYIPIFITSIGTLEDVKVSSMPSNVICCDYHEVEFNV